MKSLDKKKTSEIFEGVNSTLHQAFIGAVERDKKKIKIYKGYLFKNLYNQWVNDSIGGFKYLKEAREYIDILEKRNSNNLSTKTTKDYWEDLINSEE